MGPLLLSQSFPAAAAVLPRMLESRDSGKVTERALSLQPWGSCHPSQGETFHHGVAALRSLTFL